MRNLLRRLWPIVKWLFMAVILVAIGVKYWRDYDPDVWGRWLQRPHWLAIAGVLYLIGIGFSAIYWRGLLGCFGHRPGWLAVVRAYYIGHLGKYVPGKAWALFLRASLITGSGVPPGLATLTAFYEVLVTMASGLLVAAVLFAALGPATRSGIEFDLFRRIYAQEKGTFAIIDRNTATVLALLLLVPVLTPLLPPLFNRVIHHVSLPFRDKSTPAPAIPWSSLFQGLAVTACGWLVLGGSFAVVLYAGGEDLLNEVTLPVLGRLTAILALSYVAGFLSLLPGAGLGVREFILILFLTPELEQLFHGDRARATALATEATLVLRLVWTTAELVVGSVVYWFRATPPSQSG
jgi:glycosyltransferase 2 family protein